MATTATAATEPAREVEPEFTPYRMPLALYERLVESGVFGTDDRFFLWDGRLVEKMASDPPHVFVVSILYQLFSGIRPREWFPFQEQPIPVGDASLPEPDLAVIRGNLRDFRKRRPTAREVMLLVEVSDSSVAHDTRLKLRAYAAAGVPVYWVVNLPMSRVEVYSEPTGPVEAPTYRDRRDYGPDDEIPVVLDGREVVRLAVRDILP